MDTALAKRVVCAWMIVSTGQQPAAERDGGDLLKPTSDD